ncbi:NAD-dependent succinate-semialdehyde dehydrogenase [Variovorax sp. J22R24]|uniref:NAD-dependent succinate-semialdehyde dehydrogenase n=1 Tax=Variovorax gracilis TaxID=3053502 RepID=UPI0025782F89|nr:NAD-dependent succinate-semialdehyde dehydrogenase [Variovorax sp. J22R24]MDM0109177.1 NAD-dependent succinate-semialdehyde dehydrogenase [Variovorax sp. J22R24]
MPLSISRDDLIRTGNFIAGRWTEPTKETFGVRDPADGSLIAEVTDSDGGDAKAAVDAASAALPSWRAATARSRAQVLKRWHALILSNQEDLARLISREQGKPLAEARGEILYAAGYVEWFAEEATRTYGDVIPETVRGRKMLVVKEGVGVVAAITPWNFPAAMMARKLAPALAAGCTVVAKPAEDTPLTSLALAVLAEEAGVPPGVLNIVAASRSRAAEVVDVWLGDSRVRKITFTGSTPVGKHLARESASTLKRLSLELGGNAPFIVFDDADVDAAVDGLMAAKFRNGGQTCVSPNRVFAQREIHDEFVRKLGVRVGALKVGPATDESSQIGPMINRQAVRKITSHIQDAVAQGAKVIAGGVTEVDEESNYVAPTVLSGATSSMLLAAEETFGPVAAVFRFDTEAEVVRSANGTPYGLAAYFYSRDVSRIWRVANAIECGIVGVNEGLISSETAPFGGIKESGYGREGSRRGLDDYMDVKYVCQGGLS